MTSRPIFAIDPGNVESGWVIYYPDTHTLGEFGVTENRELRIILRNSRQWDYRYAFEMPTPMKGCVGVPGVHMDVLNTAVWIGRLLEKVYGDGDYYEPAGLVKRSEVIKFLGVVNNAKGSTDSKVRSKIIDLFPAEGGGTTPQIGTKKQPGRLYGMSSHMWPALGVALTYAAKTKNA